MSETEFQREIFARLGKQEQQLAAISAMLGERCNSRAGVIDDLYARVSVLEEARHRLKGAMAVLTAVATAAGAFGAVVAKVLPAWSK